MASNSQKIRVALIGLSASAKVSWAEEGHLAYLQSPHGSKRYEVVALLNSSIKAAESAQSHFNLPTSVKCYGDPEALAADPNVDLVVCNTRVDVHFPTTAPSLRVGKAVFVEWPLTENLQKALDLTKNKEYLDSIIGLQGRVSPITLRVKEILASGAVGKVLSSTIQSFGNLLQRDSFPETLTYFGDRKVGGHQINIANGHMIDYVLDVLGGFKDFQGRMQNQRPVKKVVDGNGAVVGETESDVPDFLTIHGALKKETGKADIADGATLVSTFRHGTPFKGHPGFEWSINGTKGELLITAPGPYLMSDSYDGPIKIELHDHATDTVKDLGWDWKDWQKELPIRSRIVAELYERYAEWVQGGRKGVKEGRDWPRLQDAVLRMEFFHKLYKQYDPSW